MMSKEQNNEYGNTEAHVYRVTLQDYWVDLLGGLLPGALFVVFLSSTFFPALLILTATITKDTELHIGGILLSLVKSTKDTPSMMWFGFAAIAFSVFYIVGHVFYRKDPKIPNQRSFERLMIIEAKRMGENNGKKYLDEYLEKMKSAEAKYSTWKEEQLSNRVIDISFDKWLEKEGKSVLPEPVKKYREILKKKYGCTTIDDCEFPYPYFADYLSARGLEYLLRYVLWRDDADIRTKNAINILKVRIRFHYPDRCATIIRNEAHIRLASSTWYLGRVVVKATYVSIGIMLFSIALFLWFYCCENGKYDLSYVLKNYQDFVAQALFFLFLIGLLGVGGFLASRHIESFMHYQRQREVVHVLETAWTAFASRDDSFIPFKRVSWLDNTIRRLKSSFRFN